MTTEPEIAPHVLDNVFLNNELEARYFRETRRGRKLSKRQMRMAGPHARKHRGDPQARAEYFDELGEALRALDAFAPEVNPVRHRQYLQALGMDENLVNGKIVDRP